MTREECDAMRASKALLVEALVSAGCEIKGLAVKCAFHEDRHASGGLKACEDGVWRYRCFACGIQGDVFDIRARLNSRTPGEELRESSSPVTRQPKPTVTAVTTPVPDRDRLFRFHETAILNALEPDPAAAKYAAARGVDLSYLTGQYCVGFMPRFSFAKWPGWILENAWSFPIPAGPDGPIVAVKLHFESRPRPGMKSMWAPFGTAPAGEPRHGIGTLWPCPEWFSKQDKIYLCPGELKALAIISAGQAAVSVTGGESTKWTPELARRFHGRSVMLVYDDDEAGHRFKDSTVEALKSVVFDLALATFGRKHGEN